MLALLRRTSFLTPSMVHYISVTITPIQLSVPCSHCRITAGARQPQGLLSSRILTGQPGFFIAYQPCARAPNIYWNYIVAFKFESINPCRDLNPGPPKYQAHALPIELSRLGFPKNIVSFLQEKK